MVHSRARRLRREEKPRRIVRTALGANVSSDHFDLAAIRPVPLHTMHTGFVIFLAPSCGLRLDRTACPVPPQEGHFWGFLLGFEFLKIIGTPVGGTRWLSILPSRAYQNSPPN